MMATTRALATAFLAACATATGPLVTVKNGTYEGLHAPGYGQDYFLGIPYAQTPLESLRFQPAQSLNETFADTRQATAYAPECVGYGSDDFGYQISEDCLYVSIVRPASNASAAPSPYAPATNSSGLPVAVWIHGGGYYMGGAVDRRYNLSFIVQNSVTQQQPIIGVSIQYRLSAWGLLYSNEVQGAGNANLALRDQRLALHWIQENIGAFGGDPAKVAIWGESAGADSVGFHLTAYGGRDDKLFRAAAMESGNPVAYQAMNGTSFYQPYYDNLVANVTPAADSVYGGKNLKSCADATDSLDCLRYVDYGTLNAAINTSFAQSWYPVVDGDFLQQYASRQLVNGQFVKVPIISGANTDEGTAFSSQGINNTDDFNALVTSSQNFGAQPGVTIPSTLAAAVEAAYPNSPCTDLPQDGPNNLNASGSNNCSVPGPPYGAQYKRAVSLQGDVNFIAERRRTCRTWAAAGVPAYCYRFNAVPFNQTTVTHFQEVAFVFDNTHGYGYEMAGAPFTGKPQPYLDLAATMSRSWASFFATLDPNAWRANVAVPPGASGGVPSVWPAYTVDGPMDIAWDANVTSYAELDTWRPGMSVLSDNAVAYQR